MKQKTLLFLLTLMLFALSCNTPSPPPQQQAAPAPDKILLATFYPVYIMTLNVAAHVPGVRVKCLTGLNTGCLHDFSLKPDDLITLSHAAVLIVNGGGMESFLDKIASESPRLPVVNAAGDIPLLSGNPHVFTSISLAMKQVQNITDGLIAFDPAHAQQYRLNSEAYLVKLNELKTRMKDALQELSSRDIVTLHEAFPYFAREFGLNIVASIEREPGSEPSAADLAGLIKTVRLKKVRALFSEPQYPCKSAGVIARETGARVFALDPAVTGPDSPDAYIAIMDRNAAMLRKALATP